MSFSLVKETRFLAGAQAIVGCQRDVPLPARAKSAGSVYVNGTEVTMAVALFGKKIEEPDHQDEKYKTHDDARNKRRAFHQDRGNRAIFHE